VLLQAQGDLKGYYWFLSGSNQPAVTSADVGGWLWRQGSNEIGQATAWSINFGAFTQDYNPIGSATYGSPEGTFLNGFNGVGTLGGGNLTVLVGGDAGVIDGTAPNFTPLGDDPSFMAYTTGINLAVGSTGRVLADGSVVETGGGDLTLRVGGGLSPYDQQYNFGTPYGYYVRPTGQPSGTLTNIRGDIDVTAGQVGEITLRAGTTAPGDPRAVVGNSVTGGASQGGLALYVGDGITTIDSQRTLVLATVSDPGRESPLSRTVGSADGQTGATTTWFTLWRPDSGIDLFSAGSDIVPDATGLLPPSLSLLAPEGNIYAEDNGNAAELIPSSDGQLTILAGDTYYGGTGAITMSGADFDTMATPQHPGYVLIDKQSTDFDLYPATPYQDANYISTNFSYIPRYGEPSNALDVYVFGPDTITGWDHQGDTQPIRVYAGQDIDDLNLGLIRRLGDAISGTLQYVAAKPVEVRAGRDIVRFGSDYTQPIGRGSWPIDGTVESFIANFAPTDVSVISAGRDILYADAVISGPGTLEVTAGRNLYQGAEGDLESIGALYGVTGANLNSGANIIALAGVGSSGPDYADFASLYLDPANASGSADTPGKVVATYQAQLLDWMKTYYGFTGSAADALTAFEALPTKEQSVFLLQVYFQELVLSGREYNDPTSRRFHSYLRGHEAINVLFPTATDGGDVTMFSGPVTTHDSFNNLYTNSFDAGIHTDFGGNIMVLAPFGKVTVGAESIIPGAGTGLLTQGAGDVDVYSQGSIALGLSRVFTTFGGAIALWSDEGDINAGRGAKTSVVFAPSRLVYDDYGDEARSPTVPTTGAGIATLDPIPEIPPGDVDLIAPLGTVDAGEAGIRVSGNVNVAALHVVNAANIQVKGTATGLPQAVVVNTNALTTASNAASAISTEAERLAERARPRIVPDITPTILTVQFLGFGE
jgi:hypothetical protein